MTHRLVYSTQLTFEVTAEEIERKVHQILKTPVVNILDAIMLTSGNDHINIRTTAFSTLSSLSKYSSQCKSVMAQIQRDIDIPPELGSKGYHDFMKDRLQKQKDGFYEKHKDEKIEKMYSGLYTLLRLGQ